MDNTHVIRLLEAAQAAQRAGQGEKAAEHLEEILKVAPDNPQALNSLGIRALNGNDGVAAAALFERAISADSKAPELWMNLAKAHRLRDDRAAERRSLEGALAIDQRHFMANVRLAELHERVGDQANAAFRWSAVLQMAVGLDTSNPGLADLLAHAQTVIDQNRRDLLQAVSGSLAGALESTPADERRRFDACMDMQLRGRRAYVNECHGLFFPFLPPDEFFPRSHFPWMESIEARTDAITAELRNLLDNGGDGLVPYVAYPSGTPDSKWRELDHSERWSAYFLWHHGTRNDAACALCPETAAAIAALPLAEVPGRAPTAFFSLLHPRTRIPPHTGVTNTRTIIHLPLIVPEGCGFRVGGETRQWKVGEAFGFDDTIEHEAWNDSDELRAVLIFDVGNPHMSATEHRLLADFYAAADASGYNPEPIAGL